MGGGGHDDRAGREEGDFAQSGQETLSPNLLPKLSEASREVGDSGVHETHFFCVELRKPGA